MENQSVIDRTLAAFRSALPEPLTGPLLLCVSGGADSMAMLHCAVRLGIPSVAVNCNFHLRGEESDRDSRFVAAECEKTDIRLIRVDFDTAAYIRSHRVSLEMACRELRYSKFRELRRELGASRIVVAHNAGDNAETLLLNLMRGAGVKGLAAMSSDDGEILRPLLGIERSQIEAFLKAVGARYVTDSSNLFDEFSRNFIRLRVLPLLEERWPSARKSIAASIANLRRADAICADAVESALPEPGFVSLSALSSFPSPLTLLHTAFRPLGATDSQLREMLATRRTGARWRLPQGDVSLTAKGFLFTPSQAPRQEFEAEPRICSAALVDEARANNTETRAFVAGTADAFLFRDPQPGDRIDLLGGGSKPVSRVLKDAGIAAPRRETWSLLVEKATGRIVWIPGVRRSRHCLLSPATPSATIFRLKS